MTTVEVGQEQQIVQPIRHLVAGRYRLLAQIGRGRLGEIYEADDEGHRDLGVKRRVAIQLLPDSVTLDRRLLEKLKLGYTVLRAAPHPNIVPFLDFDHDGKFGYLVTDLLEGVSLRFVLDDSTTLALDEAIPVIRAVGDALQFLHANSMVHGRLTAENVFITESFEVRLLDIVPLDSATTILRNVASGDPFSRCDVADDIYGLACLAYEMLAGKHPFNFHDQAKARHAGLKPARIGSLPEKPWNALCHALSFDRERRTPAVAEFLREFGIKGTERLRPSEDATAKRDPPSAHPVNEVPAATRSTGSSSSGPAPAPVAPASRTVPVARPEEALDVARAKGKRARRLRLYVLLMVLIGLGAWYFYGQPRDEVARLIDYVDSYIDDISARSEESGLPLIGSDHGPAALTDAAPEAILPPPVAEAVAEDDALAEASGEILVDQGVASSEFTADTTDEVTSEPADEQLADSGTEASPPNDDAAMDELAATTDADTESQAEPGFTLIQSVVYVSERDGAARIASRHPGEMIGRVFWWTGDNTAIAEKDYIPIEQPVEAFTSGEVAETLHVPLVNDGLPEPPETFHVYLGQYNNRLGRLEPIARIRVEIKDDDWR